MFHIRENERSSGGVADAARGGLDVLQQPPPLGQQREPALAQASQPSLQPVERPRIGRQGLALIRAFDRGYDTDARTVVYRIGQRGQAAGRRDVEGGPRYNAATDAQNSTLALAEDGTESTDPDVAYDYTPYGQTETATAGSGDQAAQTNPFTYTGAYELDNGDKALGHRFAHFWQKLQPNQKTH
ncbi:hypothetical protein FHX37_3327 [Haloactinospora alba]|uniref:Uncharacterized protein n=1 Tax=Haloactinospora alba TaxID=405555 RepID=A0A543NNB1_9ACTN|nr:hypothetical protein FHX37_3327 [Haloactinospora alba]